MTYGRSIYRALAGFGIDRSAWPALAANRGAWRGAIHGALLDGGRPTRAAAAVTNRLIDVAVADDQAGARNIGAAAATRAARAAALLS